MRVPILVPAFTRGGDQGGVNIGAGRTAARCALSRPYWVWQMKRREPYVRRGHHAPGGRADRTSPSICHTRLLHPLPQHPQRRLLLRVGARVVQRQALVRRRRAERGRLPPLLQPSPQVERQPGVLIRHDAPDGRGAVLREAVQVLAAGPDERPARQLERDALEPQNDRRLDARLAAGPLADDGGPVVILEGRRDQLGPAEGVGVDEDDEGEVAELALRRAALRRVFLAARLERGDEPRRRGTVRRPRPPRSGSRPDTSAGRG